MVQQGKLTNAKDRKTGIAFEYMFVLSLCCFICENIAALPSMKQLYSVETFLATCFLKSLVLKAVV